MKVPTAALVGVLVVCGACGQKKPLVIAEQPPTVERPAPPQSTGDTRLRDTAAQAIARAETAVADADAAGARTLAAQKFGAAVAKLAEATDAFSVEQYLDARDAAVVAENLAREAEAEARAAARRRPSRSRPVPPAMRTPLAAAPAEVAPPAPEPIGPVSTPAPRKGRDPLAGVAVVALIVGGGAALFLTLKPKAPKK